MMTVSEYRKKLGDNKSTDDQIIERLNYLEAFFRNIIRIEIDKYILQSRSKTKKKL